MSWGGAPDLCNIPTGPSDLRWQGVADGHESEAESVPHDYQGPSEPSVWLHSLWGCEHHEGGDLFVLCKIVGWVSIVSGWYFVHFLIFYF